MKLIGLTGGVGSGKSTVARMFRELGASIVDAFGDEYVRDGRIDRARLGDRVFKNSSDREILNAIVHPLVRQWMADKTAEAVERGAGVVIQDVPLLFENGLQGLFSATVLVYAPPATQLERLIAQRRVDRERALAIIAAQMPIDDKRALADYVIDNSGAREDTRRQVEEVWASLRAL